MDGEGKDKKAATYYEVSKREDQEAASARGLGLYLLSNHFRCVNDSSMLINNQLANFSAGGLVPVLGCSQSQERGEVSKKPKADMGTVQRNCTLVWRVSHSCVIRARPWEEIRHYQCGEGPKSELHYLLAM